MKNKIIRKISFIFFTFILVFTFFTSCQKLIKNNENNDITIIRNKKLKMNDEFSILTWNIGHCYMTKKRHVKIEDMNFSKREKKNEIKKNIKDITKQLKDINSDIIIMQEVDKSSYLSYYNNQKEEIADNLDNYGYSYAPNIKHKLMKSGLMLMSKFRIKEVKKESLKTEHNSYLISEYTEHNSFHVSRYDVCSNKEFVLINLQLLKIYNSNIIQSIVINGDNQLFIMKFVVAEFEKGNYVIVGGDWNLVLDTDLTSDEIKHKNLPDWLYELAPMWNLKEWTWVYDKNIPTIRDPESEYIKGNSYTGIVDGFLLSPNIDLIEVKTIDQEFKYSYHNPVLIKVKLK